MTLTNQQIIHLQRTILAGVIANESLSLRLKFSLDAKYFRHPLHKKIIELQNDPTIEPKILSFASGTMYDNELISILAITPVINWKAYYDLVREQYILAKVKQ